jgi:hypothetical protein
MCGRVKNLSNLDIKKSVIQNFNEYKQLNYVKAQRPPKRAESCSQDYYYAKHKICIWEYVDVMFVAA